MGTHLRVPVLIAIYPMNNNMTGFRRFSKIFCIFVEICFSIGRVKGVVRYYIRHGSPVFACYLDASKPFDRVLDFI